MSATTYTLASTPARRIIGLPLRTDNTCAFETIPAHWQRFRAESVPDRIASACGRDLYAVYARFENLDVVQGGGIAQLRYTLLIGLEVPAGSDAPPGLEAIELPAQTCAVFAVPDGQPQQVGASWQQIWARNDLARTFVADAERYRPDGRIDILVGLR